MVRPALGPVFCPPLMLDQSQRQVKEPTLSQETEMVVVLWGRGKKQKSRTAKKEPIRLWSCAHPALLNANHALGNPIHLSPPLSGHQCTQPPFCSGMCSPKLNLSTGLRPNPLTDSAP